MRSAVSAVSGPEVRAVIPPPVHRATAADLKALHPLVPEGGVGEQGVYIGQDLLEGHLCMTPGSCSALVGL